MPKQIKTTTIQGVIAKMKAQQEAYEAMSPEEKAAHDEKLREGMELFRKITGAGVSFTTLRPK